MLSQATEDLKICLQKSDIIGAKAAQEVIEASQTKLSLSMSTYMSSTPPPPKSARCNMHVLLNILSYFLWKNVLLLSCEGVRGLVCTLFYFYDCFVCESDKNEVTYVTIGYYHYLFVIQRIRD
jgi:hypothetical protein